jgi:hypothetical protein
VVAVLGDAPLGGFVTGINRFELPLAQLAVTADRPLQSHSRSGELVG